MKRAIIVHGYTGHPDKNWFPWLATQLQEAGFAVTVPEMPTPEAPQLSQWLPYLAEVVGTPDQDTYLIGHSLGCITILRYLESLTTAEQVGGVVLVAGFSRPIHLTQLNNFFEEPLQYQVCKVRAKGFVCINSDNDPHVPLEDGEVLRDELGAELIVYPGGGHLNEKSGFTEFPLVRESVLGLSKE